MNEDLRQTTSPTDEASGRLQKDAANRLFTVEEVMDLIAEEDPEEYPMATEGDNKTGFFIPGRSAAIAMGFLAIACLTSLVLVTTAEGADALSTIALALAVLAFVIQIAVFTYQSAASNQQMLQSEQLFTETRTLLAEVNTAARSTETLVREQFRDILQAFLDTQPGSKQETKFLTALRSELAASQLADDSRNANPPAERPKPRVVAKRRARKQIFEFPDENTGAPVVKDLENLEPSSIERLRILAEDFQLLAGINSLETQGEPIQPGDKVLEEAGLTHTARIDMGSAKITVSQLTEKGIVAANILMATGNVPSYAKRFATKLNTGDS